MRTTLTLDDDVAAALARRRAERGTGLRKEVNDLLRAGLAAASRPSDDSGEPYELPTFRPRSRADHGPQVLKDLLDERRRSADAPPSRVILVDVNLLVEATMTSAAGHEAARSWLQERLAGTARVGLPWASITGFIRVVGQPRVWERPMPVGGAVSVVRSWLSRPSASIPEPGPSTSTSSTRSCSPSSPCGF